MNPNDVSVVGIDIGGANLKYATQLSGRMESAPAPKQILTRSRSFPMWQRHERLADELIEDLKWIARRQAFKAMAVTMTGELADCFLDRAEGVQHLVNHVCAAAVAMGVDDVWFYGVDGAFYPPEDAPRVVDCLASANWHALASFVGQTWCRDGLLIDVGSTTADIIPLAQGSVASDAKTDYDRLVEGSLVYIGGRRTPVAMLVNELVHRGRWVAVMNEVFATMDDVRIVLGHVPGDVEPAPSEHESIEAGPVEAGDTADGRPRSTEMAVNRLARMIGLDHRQVTTDDAVLLARQIHRVARQRISKAIGRVSPACGEGKTCVISGHAPDLIDVPMGTQVLGLAQQLGDDVSRVAPAHAVAWLLASELSRSRPKCGA